MASRELASFARVADICIRNHNSIMLRSAAFMAQEKKKIRREHNSYGGAVTLCCVSNRSSLAWNHRGERVRRPFKSTIYNNVRSSPKSLRTLTAWLLSAVIDHAGYLQQILNCEHAAVLSGLLLLLLPVFGGKGQSQNLQDSSDLLTWHSLIPYLTAKATIRASENCPFLKVRLKFLLRLFNLGSPVREAL